MTLEQILEIIERYKLRIPPTVYYDLKADIVNCSEIPTGSTTKNDIAVDCIDRNYATRLLADIYHNSISDSSLKIYQIINWLNQLPSITPQEPREVADYENEIADLHKRLDIAEYDKERLREEVTNLDAKIKALEQEPFINKPCVSSGVCEHDKQKVLDKIRAEIEQITDTMGVSYNQYVSKIDVLQILDKYKAETEE